MRFLEKLGKVIKDFAEPRINKVNKYQAEKFIELVGKKDGYGWNFYRAKILYEEMRSNADLPELDIEILEKMARYNYPDNAAAYIPALLIFAGFFSMLLIILC